MSLVPRSVAYEKAAVSQTRNHTSWPFIPADRVTLAHVWWICCLRIIAGWPLTFPLRNTCTLIKRVLS